MGEGAPHDTGSNWEQHEQLSMAQVMESMVKSMDAARLAELEAAAAADAQSNAAKQLRAGRSAVTSREYPGTGSVTSTGIDRPGQDGMTRLLQLKMYRQEPDCLVELTFNSSAPTSIQVQERQEGKTFPAHELSADDPSDDQRRQLINDIYKLYTDGYNQERV
jgi:hypothetical protein